MTLDESTADYFLDQCFGQYNGHMAEVPYHPVLKSLGESHDIVDKNGRIDAKRALDFMQGVCDYLGTMVGDEANG